ncbi:MAG: hypothetical protein RR555_04365 [Bacteroidales bacterium]
MLDAINMMNVGSSLVILHVILREDRLVMKLRVQMERVIQPAQRNNTIRVALGKGIILPVLVEYHMVDCPK